MQLTRIQYKHYQKFNIMNAEKMVLANADTLQAISGTASAITASVSYVSI